ncbi:PAS domain S-box protein [Paludibaculum fermentans]|uniref:PAS domain S-box protein n=1 Tax=Paludibaculum fermentans TaxID=1473598 RepID=UPI003EBB2A33
MSDPATPHLDPCVDFSVPLEAVLCEGELHRRPVRPPDYENENRALVALAKALVDSTQDVLQVLTENILHITQSDSSGISLVTRDDGGRRIYWPAIAGAWNPHTGSGSPRECGPCGVALEQNRVLLFHRFERRYTLFRAVMPAAEECLVVPFYVDGRAVGTMWAITHSDRRKFDSEDERVMQALGQFAAVAYQTRNLINGLSVQIAAREEAESALRRSASGVEQRARSIIESALDAAVAMNSEGAITEWNRQAEQIFGWPREEALGKSLAQTIIPVQFRAAHEQGRRRFFETGVGQVLNRRIEMTAMHRSGREFPVELSVTPVKVGESWSFHAFVRDISERKHAEGALRASEQNLALIINTIPILVWSASPDGFADYLSQHYLDYSGLSADQALGWAWTIAVHPDDRGGLTAYWRSILSAGTGGEYEARLRRFDGVYRWFLIRARPLRDEQGSIVKWYGTNTDIEDRKVAEEALRGSEGSLRESEESLLVMFNAIPALVCTLNAAWEVQQVNQQLLDYFGIPLESLKNWAFIGVVHPDDLEDVVARCRHSVEAGTSYDIEHRCRRNDGVFRWFHVRGRPLRNAEGRIIRWYVVLIDVEDRKRAEETLRKSEHDLRRLTETIPAMVWSARPDGEIDYCNNRFLHYTGFSPEEVTGEGWRKTIHPEDAARVYPIWMSSVRAGTPYRVEVRTLHAADGTYRWCMVTALPLMDQQGQVVKWYGTIVDMQDWKRDQEELRTMQAELAHVTRLMTMGEITASIAHEVNQPLAAAVASGDSCVAWLANTPPNVDKARAAADRVVQAVTQASSVVQRIRTMVKKAPVVRSRLEINEVIVEAVSLIQSEVASKRIALQTDLAENMRMVDGDRVQITQVILNLAMNGIEAMSQLDSPARRLMIRSTAADHKELRVAIADNGPGLDPDITGHLFNPFFTTKREGIGMGLSISKSIIEAHGGRLWATPNEPRGAVFHFALPTTPDK